MTTGTTARTPKPILSHRNCGDEDPVDVSPCCRGTPASCGRRADDAIDPEIEAHATLEAMLDSALKPRERAKKLAEITGLDAREIYDRSRAWR